ncbi:hypothetical protein ACN4DP_08895 [Corynebacterium macclintockiae]|uniref:hypothetical protein n=1 Tax=Corynebacterium macclintockiae TaxID=2913501 RepID=UPI000557F82C
MKRIATATVAAATALSLAAAPAQAAPSTPTNAQKVEMAKLAGIFVLQGTGAAPNTGPTGKMAAGSVMAGSSAKTAYGATQFGWALTWIAVAAAGIGLIGAAAKQAGLLR